MGVVWQQSEHGEELEAPEGVTDGRLSLTRNGCTFRGALGDDGERLSTLRFDTSSPYGIQAGVIVGGGACTLVTFEDLIFDGNNWTGLVAMFSSNIAGGPVYAIFRRCLFMNFSKSTISLACAAHLVLEDCDFAGNGLCIQISEGALGLRIRRCTAVGGTGVVIVGGSTGTVYGIDIDGLEIEIDFWQTAPGETVVPTSFEAQRVIVEDHDPDARSQTDCIVYEQPIGTFTVGDDLPAAARDFDRVETAAGVWGQVEGGEVTAWRASGQVHEVAAPTGSVATLYRITLGKVRGWSTTAPHYLSLDVAPGGELGHWRGVEGTPTLVRGATEVAPATDAITLRTANDDGTVTGHGLTTGDGPVRVVAAAGATLPAGLAAGTDYYAIRVDDETIKLALTPIAAAAGMAADITAVGAGDFGVLRIPALVEGARMRVLRAGIRTGGMVRDVDAGAIHVTDSAVNARIRRVNARGTFSDCITVRSSGVSNLTRACTASLTFDMDFTFGGGAAAVQNVRHCTARQAGYKGFYFASAANVVMCRAEDNGLHDDGDNDSCGVSAAAGVEIDPGAFIGNGGRDGMVKTGADVTIGGFESTIRMERA